jgi:hypothetical protein
MDVMIQGCPDYASFAWGALKFLFIVCILHCTIFMSNGKIMARLCTSTNLFFHFDDNSLIGPGSNTSRGATGRDF